MMEECYAKIAMKRREVMNMMVVIMIAMMTMKMSMTTMAIR